MNRYRYVLQLIHIFKFVFLEDGLDQGYIICIEPIQIKPQVFPDMIGIVDRVDIDPSEIMVLRMITDRDCTHDLVFVPIERGRP